MGAKVVDYATPKTKVPWKAPPWVVRFVRGMLISLILIALIHGIWALANTIRIHRMIEQYRAAGEPFGADELQPAVPDAENSAPSWRAAAQALAPTAASDDLDWLVDELAPPLRKEEATTIQQVISENTTMLAQLEPTTRSPKANWGTKLVTPYVDVILPDLNPQRAVARTMSATALYAHHQNDDAQALRWIELMLRQARAVDQEPVLVSHLSALGIDSLAARRVQQLAPELALPADKTQVRRLISQLLDDRPLIAGMKLGLRSERMGGVNDALSPFEPRPTAVMTATDRWMLRGTRYIIAPMARGDGIRQARLLTELMNAASTAPDFPTYLASAPATPAWLRAQSLFDPHDNQYVRSNYCVITERRLAATALALRMFALAHDGQLPDRLSELVSGGYLPAVPLDPMTAGRPLQYAPKHAGGAILYSVGDNGTDDGGSEYSPRVEPGHWEMDDLVVHLAPQPRLPPRPRPAPGSMLYVPGMPAAPANRPLKDRLRL